MGNFIKMTATAAAISIPLSTAIASDAQGNYIVYGVGVQPCHVFLTAIGRDREDYDNWLTGFLTASNVFLPATKNITPEATSMKFLSIVWKQCRAFHDVAVSNAAATIVSRLHDRLIANPNQNPYEGEE